MTYCKGGFPHIKLCSNKITVQKISKNYNPDNVLSINNILKDRKNIIDKAKKSIDFHNNNLYNVNNNDDKIDDNKINNKAMNFNDWKKSFNFIDTPINNIKYSSKRKSKNSKKSINSKNSKKSKNSKNSKNSKKVKKVKIVKK